MELIRLGVIDDFFNALLFGSGSWIGLLLIILLVSILAMMRKYSGKAIGLIVCGFLAVEYLGRTNVTPELAWHSFIMFVSAIFLVLGLLHDARK
jgi:uncharacterized RDD family membrane protein YckC